MITLELVRRTEYPDRILGTLSVRRSDEEIASYATLELPWRGNASNISCVPEGTYPVKLQWSNKFRRQMFYLQGTDPRSGIMIHNGNFPSQIQGCILIGTKHGPADADDVPDVINSKLALAHFMDKIMRDTDRTTLVIRQETAT